MGPDSRATVSVVIPCYNYGHYLEEAVSSVLDDQEGVAVRVLVIDDASPDGSVEVAEKIAARDDRVEVIGHERNRGHIATYNEGLLGWADGDYCVLMSADDRLTPGALTRATALLEARPDVGFVYGHAIWFRTEENLPTARTRVRDWSVWPGDRWLAERFRHARTGISSPEVVVRTSLQKQVGGYDPRLPHLGDAHMWLRLAAHANVGHVRGVDQAYYRRHPKNMSVAYSPLTTFQQYRLMFDDVLEQCGDRLADPARLRAVARRQLAREALRTAARAYDKGRVDETPIDELMAFALDCWPPATGSSLHLTLRARRRVGPRVMPYLQPLVLPSAAARRASVVRRTRRWDRRGL
jgi:hypothetical protein